MVEKSYLRSESLEIMGITILKPGREKSVFHRHPWIFSGAIDREEGCKTPGETTEIVSSKGIKLGKAAYSPQSQIRARMWTYDPDEDISRDFFRARLKQAIDLRKTMSIDSDAYRLVNAESDGLPGIIVDRYNEFIVCQFLSAGAEFWKKEIVNHLAQLLSPKGIYERSDTDARLKEGLQASAGVLWGDEPPELLEIREGNLRFWVNIHEGHKTGFYSDQRDNRALLSELAQGRDILNCFCYTGGFGVWAMACGAKTVSNADVSASVLEISKKNFEMNGLDLSKVGYLQEDVFVCLRKFRDSGKSFDMIILDPPKFVESKVQFERGARGYKDINLLAFKLLRPGGLLMTFSCSGLITPELFQKIVSDAALDAGREVYILQRLFQASDHTVSLNFPEGLYLKGLLCKVQNAA